MESFSNGFVVFFIMGQSLNDSPSSLKFIMGVMPIMAASGAYVISWLRFRNMAIQFYGEKPKGRKMH